MSTTTAIEFNRVTKYNGTDRILNNLSIKFQWGKIYGIVRDTHGSSRAFYYGILGKTPMNWGSIIVNGQRVGVDVEQPEGVSVLLDRTEFVSSMSPFQNLKAMSFVEKIVLSDEQIMTAMNQVGLNIEDNRWLGLYPNQDWMRLQFARTIMGTPPILLLKDPFVNLEERAMRDIKTMLKQYKKAGHTIFVSVKHKEEINCFCDICYSFEKGKLKIV